MFIGRETEAMSIPFCQISRISCLIQVLLQLEVKVSANRRLNETLGTGMTLFPEFSGYGLALRTPEALLGMKLRKLPLFAVNKSN